MMTPYSTQPLSYDESEENWNKVIVFLAGIREEFNQCIEDLEAEKDRSKQR